jgi:flagellar protein FlgJ
MDGKNLLTSLATVHSNQQNRSERIGNALKSAQSLATDKTDPRLRAACMEMESLFLTHLLKEMRATVDKSGFISGGRGEEIFTSLLDVELSQRMSAAGGIGLSSLLLEQLGGKAVRTDSPDSQ